MNTLKKLVFFIPVLGLILNVADLAFGWNTTEYPEESNAFKFSVMWHFIWACGLILG